MKVKIEIDNLTEAQKIAIEDILSAWEYYGNIGSSRWTSFFADGDGNFRPKILINNEKPSFTNLLKDEERFVGNDCKGIINSSGDYFIDFDKIAWKLKDQDKILPL